MPHNVLVLASRTATGTGCAYRKRERFALECVASLSPQRISLSLHTPRITKRHTTGDVLSHISSNTFSHTLSFYCLSPDYVSHLS
jgi:hypothetical protein